MPDIANIKDVEVWTSAVGEILEKYRFNASDFQKRLEFTRADAEVDQASVVRGEELLQALTEIAELAEKIYDKAQELSAWHKALGRQPDKNNAEAQKYHEIISAVEPLETKVLGLQGTIKWQVEAMTMALELKELAKLVELP